MASFVRNRLWDLRALWMRRHGVVFCSDRAGWILDHVASELAAHLPRECSPGLSKGPDLHFLRGKVVHFLGQFDIFGEGRLAGVHPSNKLVATWWHGTAESAAGGLREAFSRARESARRLDRITVTCSLYEAALRAAGVPAEKLVRLPLGVDTKRFAPPDDARRALARREVGVPREAFCVGSFQKDGVGWGEGLEPKLIKGPDLLLEAVVGVRGRNLFVLLSGPARGYVVQGLKRLAIPFAHAGFVDARRMPPLYHALDAYAVTSREDGGPAALLEAMASGVPVVSTRVGMAADLIVGGRNGFVVEVGDAVGLAAALSRLKDDVELRRRLAGEAMATAQEYDWSRVARRCYTEVYLPLLGRDATGGAT